MAVKKTAKTIHEFPTAAALAAEKKRAEGLAKSYGGRAELLDLKKARANHPELEITEEHMKDTRYFHLRFRPCSICGRFPARAIIHYGKHEDQSLDAKGNATDPDQRKAIAERVAKMRETLAAQKAEEAKASKKKAKPKPVKKATKKVA